MDKQNTFSKDKFAVLLDQAKGDRSINRYAEETNVSAAHISRFLRGMIDAPPTPETISKLSSRASKGITYIDLMVAAGHVLKTPEETYSETLEVSCSTIREPQPILQQISPSEKQSERINTEKQFFQIILSHLYMVDFDWNIQKPNNRTRFPDMLIEIDDQGYKKWLLEFKSSTNPSPYSIYGMLAVYKLIPTDKFTVVVDNKMAYESFFKKPPLSLRANLYIMLVDTGQGKVVEEEKLCSYYQE